MVERKNLVRFVMVMVVVVVMVESFFSHLGNVPRAKETYQNIFCVFNGFWPSRGRMGLTLSVKATQNMSDYTTRYQVS